MPTPKEFLDPDTVDGAEHAYEKVAGPSAHLGGAAAVLEELRDMDPSDYEGGLYSIENPEVREKLKKEILAYLDMFKAAGIEAPTIKELDWSLDLAHIAELKETHLNHDLVVAPLELPPEDLRRLVSTVANDTTIPDNPLKKCEPTKNDSDGLYIGNSIVESWDKIMFQTRAEWSLPTADTDAGRWTAFLLPGGDKPDNLSLSYAQTKNQGIEAVPIVGYVAYQMRRIARGLSPVDGQSCTWVSGEFNDGKGVARAPVVDWSASYGRLRVGSCGVGRSRGDLGVRSPVG